MRTATNRKSTFVIPLTPYFTNSRSYLIILPVIKKAKNISSKGTLLGMLNRFIILSFFDIFTANACHFSLIFFG
ncbi:DUF5009 domain-containing protein [Anoxybacteroides amylolyticum]|uniref:DUF5009 domain-containing protein n=1 Tax=Anoxybacteroides amylolyticum TaxID=294699 RepID=UPI003964806A